MRHPDDWRAYLVPHGGDLRNGDGAYLTDEAVGRRCRQTPAGTASLVHCLDPVDFPPHASPGHLWIEVETDYAASDHPAVGDYDYDGYRARIDSGSRGSLGFPVGPDGEPLPFCPQHTDYGVRITAGPRSAAVQPSNIEVTGCFGTRTDSARRAFRAMLRTMKIARTPSETAPVDGATHCRRDKLRLSYAAQGASQSIIADYTVANISHTTCWLRGFPRFALFTAHGTPATTMTYRHSGHPHRLFLQPGTTVTSFTQTWPYGAGPGPRGAVKTEHIYLPGIKRPFTQQLGRWAIPIAKGGEDMNVSPLAGT